MTNRFINAAKDGFVDILREATRRDLNTPDADGMTATLWAAQSGNLEALRLIVGREGDVNKADFLGMTALHHAAIRGHMGVVSYLVHWGCNVYALDNDFHSALDLAALYDRHEIIKFLDTTLAEKRTKNPKQANRMKEEAFIAAENNIRKYQKLTERFIKKTEKEHNKTLMERNQQLSNDVTGTESKNKPGFFKTLTLRLKGGPNINGGRWDNSTGRKSSVFSDLAGATFSDRRTSKANGGLSEFTVSELDEDGNRTVHSVNKGIVGSTSEVIYVTGDKDSQKGKLALRAKSESELLGSGINSYYDENDENQTTSPSYNRSEFPTMTFMPKNPFKNTFNSFDDTGVPSAPHSANGDNKPHSGENEELFNSEGGKNATSRQQLPWDLDDLGNLDDDEESGERSELSAVNMFLWSCGLASYFYIFAQEKVDMQVLTKMTDSDMKELGLEFGPRKKLQEAITRRKAVLETSTVMTDTHL